MRLGLEEHEEVAESFWKTSASSLVTGAGVGKPGEETSWLQPPLLGSLVSRPAHPSLSLPPPEAAVRGDRNSCVGQHYNGPGSGESSLGAVLHTPGPLWGPCQMWPCNR